MLSKMPKVPSAPEHFSLQYRALFFIAFIYTCLLGGLSREYIAVDNISDNDKQFGMGISYTTLAVFFLYLILGYIIYKSPSKKTNTYCLRFALFLFVIQIFCGIIICSHIINTLTSPQNSYIYNLASGTLIYLAIICFIIIIMGVFFLNKKNKIADEPSKTSETSD